MLKEEKTGGSPQKKAYFSSSKLELPADLPSVEETLQVLAAALKAFSFLEAWRWNLRRVKDCANSYVSKKEKSLL